MKKWRENPSRLRAFCGGGRGSLFPRVGRSVDGAFCEGGVKGLLRGGLEGDLSSQQDGVVVGGGDLSVFALLLGLRVDVVQLDF